MSAHTTLLRIFEKIICCYSPFTISLRTSDINYRHAGLSAALSLNEWRTLPHFNTSIRLSLLYPYISGNSNKFFGLSSIASYLAWNTSLPVHSTPDQGDHWSVAVAYSEHSHSKLFRLNPISPIVPTLSPTPLICLFRLWGRRFWFLLKWGVEWSLTQCSQKFQFFCALVKIWKLRHPLYNLNLMSFPSFFIKATKKCQ